MNNWREQFREIQEKYNYTDYTDKRFCCGGDYCEGDHLGFIESFIEQTLQKQLEEVIEELDGAIKFIRNNSGLKDAGDKAEIIGYLAGIKTNLLKDLDTIK